jgi:hypothetical protein
MLRADMDALPIEEATGLPYASKVKAQDREGKTVPVGHMYGHDMHVAWLIGATTLLAQARTEWRGTLMAVFQPGEETAEGAQAMINDGLFDRFPKPAVVLGQHVMVGPAGTLAGRTGAITSAADSLQIRLFGRGAHGSMPQASIDPVVMAAATVMRLQTVVFCGGQRGWNHPRPIHRRSCNEHALVGARPNRHLCLCAKRSDGGGQSPTRCLRSAGFVEAPVQNETKPAARRNQRLAIFGDLDPRRHDYLLVACHH